MPFEPGNKAAAGASHKKSRIITQKLIARLQDEDGKNLDKLISALVSKANEGDIPAIREILDRVEGKVPQGIENGDEPFELIHRIERVIVRPSNTDG